MILRGRGEDRPDRNVIYRQSIRLQCLFQIVSGKAYDAARPQNLSGFGYGQIRLTEMNSGRAGKVRPPLPVQAASLTGDGLNIAQSDIDQLVSVDREGWRNNLKSQSDYFDTFGDRLPAGIKEEHKSLANRLKA